MPNTPPDETAPPTTAEILSQTLEWHAGDMPYSIEFGDHFYSRDDGRLECDHVFIRGNRLPERWATNTSGFVIGELGFGTGLNLCETLRQWKNYHVQQDGAPHPAAHYISFERFPMPRAAIERALLRWPEIDAERASLCAGWPETPEATIRIDLAKGFSLTVVCGPALSLLSDWSGMFDAWYLDGFAPSRNPDMWSEDLMRAVFDHTAPGGSFATYAAAGFVRRNLQAAGFTVERAPGHAGKREMLRGRRPSSFADRT